MKSNNFNRMVTVVSYTPLCSIIGYVAFTKWRLRNSQHRGFTGTDMYHMRRVLDAHAVSLADNPGVRVEPDFLDAEFQNELRLDSRIAMARFGYSTIPIYVLGQYAQNLFHYLSHTRPNATRCSGFIDPLTKLESDPKYNTGQAQKVRAQMKRDAPPADADDDDRPIVAPWDAGHKFDEAQLPKSIRKLIAQIRATKKYSLGTRCFFLSVPSRSEKFPENEQAPCAT